MRALLAILVATTASGFQAGRPRCSATPRSSPIVAESPPSLFDGLFSAFGSKGPLETPAEKAAREAAEKAAAEKAERLQWLNGLTALPQRKLEEARRLADQAIAAAKERGASVQAEVARLSDEAKQAAAEAAALPGKTLKEAENTVEEVKAAVEAARVAALAREAVQAAQASVVTVTSDCAATC